MFVKPDGTGSVIALKDKHLSAIALRDLLIVELNHGGVGENKLSEIFGMTLHEIRETIAAAKEGHDD